MEWRLEGGDRVRFRELGDGRPVEEGRVRKALHVLDAAQRLVPVYVVESDAGETLVLGDGEIVERLTR